MKTGRTQNKGTKRIVQIIRSKADENSIFIAENEI